MYKNALYSLLFALTGVLFAPIFLTGCLLGLACYALFSEIRPTVRDISMSVTGKAHHPSGAAT